MLLTKERKLIASGPAQTFGLAQNCHLRIYARYTEQDIINNRTYYIAELYLYVPSGYYIGSYQNNNVKTLSATGLAGFNSYMGSADYYAQTLGTIEGWVTHETDGKKIVNISGSAYFAPWGMTLNVDTTAELPAIPRASDIGVGSSSFNIGDTITITTTKKVSTYTDKIKISFGETKDSEQYVKYLTESAEETTIWNTSDDAIELYSMIPNINRGVCQMTVETYNGDTLVGSNIIAFLLFVVNSNPQFTNFTYEDANPKTLGLTGNNQTIIKGYSNVRGIVSTSNKAIALNSATMKKYRFVIGEKQQEFDYSDLEDVGSTIEQVDNNVFTMYAIDSRNNSTSKQISPSNYLVYKKPTILGLIVERNLGGVGELVSVKVNGEFWNGDFGQEDNNVIISYRYKDTDSSDWIKGATTITPNLNGETYSFEGQIIGDLDNNGFNVENSYDIEITITDKLDSCSREEIVGSGKPNLALHKNGTAFGRLYDENEGGLIQGFYEVGDIFLSFSSENPSIRFGGVWERIKDMFLLASGDKYEVGSTGGEAEHTLTVQEMPSHGHSHGFDQLAYNKQAGTNGLATLNNSGGYVTGGIIHPNGGGKAHNNMPPYIAVFVWKRIA